MKFFRDGFANDDVGVKISTQKSCKNSLTFGVTTSNEKSTKEYRNEIRTQHDDQDKLINDSKQRPIELRS